MICAFTDLTMPEMSRQKNPRAVTAVMLDGKMEDDASLKQCLVMVELAEQLAAIDPELAKQYEAIEL